MQIRRLRFGMLILTLGLAACSMQGATPSFAERVAESAAAHQRGYKLVYTFPGGAGGATPLGGLTFVRGVMYGTTVFGGDSSGCDCGTVFAGTNVIYTFKGVASHDGGRPNGGLLKVGSELYGTTYTGGRDGGVCSSNTVAPGCGTVFAVDASGNERVVYRFKGGADGEGPAGSLVSLHGVLYGATAFGGVGKGCVGSGTPPGCGVVFAIDASGKEKVIYRFKGAHDGAGPTAGPVVLGNTLYGTTAYGGGACSYGGGCGTVYSLSTAGVETVLRAFVGGSDGIFPGHLLPFDGALYGTTLMGGCLKSCSSSLRGYGIFFKMSVTGNERIVHRFTAGPHDGAFPQGPLTLRNDKIFGTTTGGGATLDGTIFSATAKALQVRFSFARPPHAHSPVGLTLDVPTNVLYGEAAGGSSGNGVLYSYVPL